MALAEDLSFIPTGPPPPPPPLPPAGSNCVRSPVSLIRVDDAVANRAADRKDVIRKILRIVNHVIPHQSKQQHQTNHQRLLTQPDDDEESQQIQEVSTMINDEESPKMMAFSGCCLKEISWFAEICMMYTVPVAQVGPSCGFAALAMVGQLLPKSPGGTASGDLEEATKAMICWAREQNYTYMGELFSTAHLMKTLTHYFECSASLQAFSGGERISESGEAAMEDSIIQHVEKGGVVLLPYDKGPNHEPVQRNGHSAHWCVILGLVRLRRKAKDPLSPSDGAVTATYVICRHGASVKHAIWNLRDLLRSNLALQEFSPNRLDSEKKYVVSDYNDLKDLRGTAVFVDISEKNLIWQCEGSLNELASEF